MRRAEVTRPQGIAREIGRGALAGAAGALALAPIDVLIRTVLRILVALLPSFLFVPILVVRIRSAFGMRSKCWCTRLRAMRNTARRFAIGFCQRCGRRHALYSEPL